MSPKILEFKRPGPLSQTPSYAGRLLTLNPEKVRKFCCGGFVLGPKNPSAVVTEDAQMDRIHAAVQAEILLDITDDTEVKTKFTCLSKVQEENTNKKVYILPYSSFRHLPLSFLADITPEDAPFPEQVMVISCDNPEDQKLLDSLSKTRGIELHPGAEDEEKYLLKL